MEEELDPSFYLMNWDEDSNRSNDNAGAVGATMTTTAASSGDHNGGHQQQGQPQQGQPLSTATTAATANGNLWRWDPLLMDRASIPLAPGADPRKQHQPKSPSASTSSNSSTCPTTTSATSIGGTTTTTSSSGSSGSTAAISRAVSNDAASQKQRAATAAGQGPYFLIQQGRQKIQNHPLAMTSLASCPPYPAPFMMHTDHTDHQGQVGNGHQGQVGDAQQGNNHQGPIGLQEAQQEQNDQTVTAPPSSLNNGYPESPADQQEQPPFQSCNKQHLNSMLHNSTAQNVAQAQAQAHQADQNAQAAQNNATILASHFSELTKNFNASNASSMIGTNHVPVPLHYGMAVNGFHPQVNARVNPVGHVHNLNVSGGGGLLHHHTPQNANSSTGIAVPTNTVNANGTIKSNPQGHGKDGTARATVSTANAPAKYATAAATSNNTSAADNANATTAANFASGSKNSRERNEREQVRAKKITQLITELRVNMEQGGWKEEMKSKYQTLNQCGEYMKFLERSHKAKEADIENTKKLIEKKQEEQQQQRQQPANDNADVDNDDPSEKSATSSLTDSTARSTDEMLEESSRSSTSSEGGSRKKKKRKKVTLSDDIQQQLSNKKSRKSSSSRGKKRKKNKQQREGDEAQQSSAETSSMSEEDSATGNESPGGKRITFDKASSSLSDMTDSNRNDGGSTSSISSTAAVARGLGSLQNSGQQCQSSRKRDLPVMKEESKNVVNNNTKKKETEVCTTETTTTTAPHKKKRRGFHYDYKEVFLKSNVPQLIATLSGRIVVWNEFFLRATGLTERDAKRLTIFSMVKPNHLSNLYKMVAQSCCSDKSISSSSNAGSTTSCSAAAPLEDSASSPITKKSDGRDDEEEWKAVTLKCISFPSHAKSNNDTNITKKKQSPLYITVTLMEDEQRDQRCFHCVLTDCPGTNGKLGSVTPELFSMLFTPKESAKKKKTAGAIVKVK
mmetsp:Transcript_8632/g.19386  ORF Transcript_8632/g.19386 Transcript_8632/m.19386 type:complete len:962 (+) Transcript_8632:366-3251(+)|eukprot:CAMPEP_0172316016 /NCGR_PEP_ID=MMETSP1058-20130122/26968_1 /TAXON_ID=83371 /ORGANISM="Detonula confervacea, Strain CCMP 353" /LENGTH=961 /DNA_ID=CAMNT_0013030235 /DNA_START=286 /DNA_END=3174 /DNA_ORIENTATION=+